MKRNTKRDLTQLDLLEKYLIDHRITYERVDKEEKITVDGYRAEVDQHQIFVPGWDAICQRGSYGAEEGLLEIYGEIVDYEKDGDTVVGYLTAEDVIKRIEDRQ